MEIQIEDIPLPENLPDLSGKVALITGTTSGFGERFAKILSKAGASVALTGRRVERLATLEEEIKSAGGKTVSLALDVTDTSSIAQVVEDTEKHLGPIDILINNAGMNVEGQSVDLTEDDFNKIWQTNVSGCFFMAQQVGKRMIQRKAGGNIINIASIGALTVLPGLTAYCMSKAAVVTMTKNIAREWAKYNINVNALCPGYIETEINADWFRSEGGQKQLNTFPRRRLGHVADLDGIIVLLSSDQSRFMTGSIVTVDDGQTLKGF